MRVTALSACPWLAHTVSCPIQTTLRPLQTRFRFAFDCLCLKLATWIDSLAHSPKGTPSGLTSLRPVVSAQFQVLFHSPRRGSFHLSLTVLFHYRSSGVFSLGPWSAQLPTELACSVVLRILAVSLCHAYGTLTLFGRPSQTVPLRAATLAQVLQPRPASWPVWALPLSLATTRRIFSSPPGT